MARTKNPTVIAEVVAAPFNEGAARTELAAANQLAVIQTEANARVAALATTLRYEGSTDPAALENSARDALRRLGATIFELGAYLLLLKESCAHGEFLPALERLGIGPESARRYMVVTRRFANSSSTRNLEGVGIGKLAELLPLEDGQIEDLTELGQTGELALDDVSRMSLKELRAAVYKERHKSAKREVEIERLEAVNTELHAEARRIKREKPDEARNAVHTEALQIGYDLLARARGDFRQALLALSPHGEHADTQHLMAGMVGQLQAVLTDLREEFGLPDMVGDGTPEWQRWAAAQGTPADNNVPDLVVGKPARKPAH